MPSIDEVINSDNNDTTNTSRQEWFDKHGLPPQCKRRVYMDGNGILRSIVICESMGTQRIYHNR